MQLDLGLLIAGAKERGKLESRVTSLLSEIRAAGDVMLMCAPHPRLVMQLTAVPSGSGSLLLADTLTVSLHAGLYLPTAELLAMQRLSPWHVQD